MFFVDNQSQKTLIFSFAKKKSLAVLIMMKNKKKKTPKKNETSTEMQARPTPWIYFFVEAVRRPFTGKALCPGEKN